MNTTQPSPLVVGQIVGTRAGDLMPGDVIRWRYYDSVHPVISVSGGVVTVITPYNDKHSISFNSDLWLRYYVVWLAPRKPAINYDDASPLTREVVEEYGFDYPSGSFSELRLRVRLVERKYLLGCFRETECAGINRSITQGGFTNGQFAALMFALGIERKESK